MLPDGDEESGYVAALVNRLPSFQSEKCRGRLTPEEDHVTRTSSPGAAIVGDTAAEMLPANAGVKAHANRRNSNIYAAGGFLGATPIPGWVVGSESLAARQGGGGLKFPRQAVLVR